MTPIVETLELSRWYGIVMGLNNVTFSIGPGLTGLVGPNGAGKSTLIQIITGQLEASSGTLRVFGQDPHNNPGLLRRIGYCPERESIPKDLRPLEWLKGLGLISGIAPHKVGPRAEAMLELVRLPKQHWSKTLGQYSKGMKQRVKLAQALMHEPDLIVLDEPMNGLDPMGRQEIATILKHLATGGTSVIISSHILPELEALCQNILILNWGRVLASGSQQEIRADLRNWSDQLKVRCDRPEDLARHLFLNGHLKGYQIEGENQDVLLVHLKDPGAFYGQASRILLESGVTIFELSSQSRSLKQIFEKVTA